MAIAKALIILSIVLCAMISYLPVFRDFLAFPDKLRDQDISRYEQRFEAAKRILPEYGVIGYRSDCNDITDINCLAGFYLAQYAVSPVILDRSPGHALILGNYSSADPTELESESNTDGMSLLMDSGNGIKLYRMDGK